MSLTNDEDDGSTSVNIEDRDFKKMHEKFNKVGYADGVAEGTDSVFQVGFDKGYSDGLKTGFELEKFRSFASTILNKKSAPEELVEEAKIYNSLNIPETLNSEHFQYTNYEDANLKTISNQQSEYLEKQLQQLTEKLPKTYNLFSLKN